MLVPPAFPEGTRSPLRVSLRLLFSRLGMDYYVHDGLVIVCGADLIDEEMQKAPVLALDQSPGTEGRSRQARTSDRPEVPRCLQAFFITRGCAERAFFDRVNPKVNPFERTRPARFEPFRRPPSVSAARRPASSLTCE